MVSQAHHSSPEEHLPLHALEFQILLSLMDGPAHAYAVVRSIEESQPEWSRILPTNLYRRIWRLEERGLISAGEPEPGSDRRVRRHFALTGFGRRVAAAEAARLRDLLRQADLAGLTPISSGDGA